MSLTKIRVYSSFGASPARGIARPPCVIVGGTPLLGQFFDEVAHFRDCSELWICSPFVDGRAASWMPQLTSLTHRGIGLNFITASETALRDAWTALTPLGWRAFQFGLYDGWHAKIYLAIDRRQGRICLTGSHNFTNAGASANYETGTLLVSYGDDEVADAVFAVREELEAALRNCRRIFDVVNPVHDTV